MALLKIERAPIEVEISAGNLPFANRRFGCLSKQYLLIDRHNLYYLRLWIKIKVFMLGENGELGAEMTDLLPTREETLAAENDTLVDARTGEVLSICPSSDVPGESSRKWAETIEQLSKDRDTMLQGDYFATIATTQPFVYAAMIKGFITEADAVGKFA